MRVPRSTPDYLGDLIEAWTLAPLSGCSLVFPKTTFAILWSIWQERAKELFEVLHHLWMLFSSSCSKDGEVGHLKEGIQELKVRELCNIRKHAWSRGLLNWWNWITSLLLQKVIWNLMWMGVGTTRGNLGLASISGVLRNDKWEVTFMFSKHVGVKDSNEEMWATLEALLHSCSLLDR